MTRRLVSRRSFFRSILSTLLFDRRRSRQHDDGRMEDSTKRKTEKDNDTKRHRRDIEQFKRYDGPSGETNQVFLKLSAKLSVSSAFLYNGTRLQIFIHRISIKFCQSSIFRYLIRLRIMELIRIYY